MSASVVVRGSGSIGQRHARVFRQVGADVSLWPVRERGRAGASDDGVDAATGARLLGDATGPAALRDALVVIATDTSRHVADALEALDAGADTVLVEKPVAPTADDARAPARAPPPRGGLGGRPAAGARRLPARASPRRPARAGRLGARLVAVVAARLATRP